MKYLLSCYVSVNSYSFTQCLIADLYEYKGSRFFCYRDTEIVISGRIVVRDVV